MATATRTITVRPMGGTAKKVKVSSNATVKQILEEANISLDEDKKIKMVANGVMLSLSSKMGKHNEILLIPTVKGGQ